MELLTELKDHLAHLEAKIDELWVKGEHAVVYELQAIKDRFVKLVTRAEADAPAVEQAVQNEINNVATDVTGIVATDVAKVEEAVANTAQ